MSEKNSTAEGVNVIYKAGDEDLNDDRGKTFAQGVSVGLGLIVFRSQAGPTHCTLNNVAESFTSSVQPTFIHSFQLAV